ncbi:rhomboid family intramembrane serine protease [Mucilaginibacter terrae]|uniref:Membrane associated rhomboid family serine protease n=1 Tax=Mucilaginibacter terrae TaxID=1955052 RepID=A0ABU3GU38_9SPHI|nr:rhomboid family intramembrane serine protease [Mucilaginibacter terrae]MDT3403287.1 membrane associated rhomboid family serine protease [Mucilaginibacter terrae]
MSMYRQGPFDNITPVVKNILILNVIFFIATYALTSVGIDLRAILAAHYPGSPYFRPWQIITYLFMHADIFHIFSNMLGLLFIGPLLEQTFGSKRFFNYYFITGIGALAMQIGVQAIEVYNITGSVRISQDFMPTNISDAYTLGGIYKGVILGASGSIFGLMMGIFLLYPNLEVYLYLTPVKVKYFVPIYFLIEIYQGLRPTPGDSVAHYAHIGGALFGFILIKLWGYKNRNNFY